MHSPSAPPPSFTILKPCSSLTSLFSSILLQLPSESPDPASNAVHMLLTLAQPPNRVYNPMAISSFPIFEWWPTIPGRSSKHGRYSRPHRWLLARIGVSLPGSLQNWPWTRHELQEVLAQHQSQEGRREEEDRLLNALSTCPTVVGVRAWGVTKTCLCCGGGGVGAWNGQNTRTCKVSSGCRYSRGPHGDTSLD